MKLIKLCLCFILMISTVNKAMSQQYVGLETDDWNVMNSLYMNPANIAASHEKISINIFSINLSLDNSLGTFSKLGDISNSLNSNHPTSIFSNSGNNNFNMLVPSGQVRGPGIVVSIDDKQSVALTTGIRVINQFNNFNQSLYNTMSDPNYVSSGSYNYTTKNFNWTAQLWSEMGLSYARVLVDNDNSILKVGATLRYMGGIAYLGLKGNNINATVTKGNDSFYAANSDIEFASNILSANSAVTNGFSSGQLLDKFLGTKTGSGVGGDIGVIYQYCPNKNDKTMNRKDKGNGYKLSLSASVTDIGSINYKSGSNYIINASGSGYLTGKGLANNLQNYSQFKQYMTQQGYRADTSTASTRVYMPTALALGADYQAYQRFYANLTFIGNLANRQNFGNSVYNQVTLTPRYDSHLLSFGLPITYSSLAGDVKMGVAVRVPGFFFGSEDMLALFSDHQHGFGFYFGGYVPLYKKQNKTEPEFKSMN